MAFLRNILKFILGGLSKWAIRKHDIDTVVVTGFVGTEIAKEGIYEVLSTRYNVRRNTHPISWDLGLPLTILGYKDKRRSVFGWIRLIVRTSVYLTFGPKNRHILVLNLNCTIQDTAKFWSSFLCPHYLVLLNDNNKSKIVNELLQNFDSEKSFLIYNVDQITESRVEKYKIQHKLSFSNSQQAADLSYEVATKTFKYKSNRVVVPEIAPVFTYPFLAAIFSTAIAFKIPLKEAALDLLKFDIGKILTRRISNYIETNRG